MLPLTSLLASLGSSTGMWISFDPVSQLESQTVAWTAATAVAALSAAVWMASSSSSSPTLLTKDGKPVQPREIPRPPSSLPVVGDMYSLHQNRDRFYDWIADQCKHFDYTPWRLNLPGQPSTIVVSSVEEFEQVLNTHAGKILKGEAQIDQVKDVAGTGIVGSEGERWFHQRKTGTKFFTARSLSGFMASSARRNLLRIADLLETHHQQQTPVNLTRLIFDFTLQTFVEVGVGAKLDWIGREEPHPFQVAMDEAAVMLSQRQRKPQWLWRAMRALNIGSEAKLAANMKYVKSWLSNIVHEGLAAAAAKKASDGDVEAKSVVELFAEHSREDMDGLRSTDLVDFVQVMLIAARDTTAITLTWFFYELSKNPDVEAKIREELWRVYPTRAGRATEYFAPQDARPLVYLEATLKETLRLHSPLPGIRRQAIEDTVISDDVLLRQGEFISVSVYSAARNPTIWGPDAAEFKPERWIDEQTGEVRQFPSSKFATFGSGARICIGRNLAMLELRAMVCNLLSRFHFELDPSVNDKYAQGFLLPMKSPVIATVHAAEPPSQQ